MQSSAPRPADVLLFHCGHCRTELSVPLVLQGVIGPCPCCSLQIQAPQAVVQLLFLPPLDGAHEGVTAPVALADWLGLHLDQTTPPPASEWNLPRPRGDISDGLLPRRLAEHESLGFRAKLSIPQSDEPLDETWRDRHLAERRRSSSLKQLDRATEQFLDSRAWRIARTALLVTTGGLCAGLAIYLQDRNWVLELPWKPGPVETVVKVPLVMPAARTRALDPADPFLTEDPSDLEITGRQSALLPLPGAVAIPIGAAPIASGKK